MQSSPQKQVEWEQQIKSWRESGLTQTAYCEQSQLKPHQFIYWKKKIEGKPNKPGTSKPNGFAQVQTMSARSAGLTLSLPGGIQISEITETNVGLLKRLLESL